MEGDDETIDDTDTENTEEAEHEHVGDGGLPHHLDGQAGVGFHPGDPTIGGPTSGAPAPAPVTAAAPPPPPVHRIDDGQGSVGLHPVATLRPAGERKTIEEWGMLKGMLPQFGPGERAAMPRRIIADKMGTVEMNLTRLKGRRPNPNFWKFAAAKRHLQCPVGYELTEAEFDAAVKAATEDHQLT